MHLVRDIKKYEAAKKKGISFYWTACESAEPISQLTTERHLVTCDGCRQVAPPPSPAHRTGSMPSEEAEEEPLEMDFEDLDEDFDALHPSAEEEEGHGKESREEKEETEDPLAALKPMLDMVLAGFNPDYSDSERWNLSIEEDSEVLGSHGIDIRSLLEEDELEFITTLIGLSQMVPGIEPLTTRVLAIIHRILDISAGQQVAAANQAKESASE